MEREGIPITSTKEPRYFNTGHAVEKLLSGVHTDMVFPGLKRLITKSDFEETYVDNPENEGRKEVVATIRTAASMDIVNALPNHFSPISMLESAYIRSFSPQTLITPDSLVPQSSEPSVLLASTIKSIEGVDTIIKDFQSGKKHGPILESVINASVPVFAPLDRKFSQKTIKEIAYRKLSVGVETATNILPAFFNLIIEQYGQSHSIDGSPTYPTYEEFWKRVSNSPGLLKRGSGLNERSLSIYFRKLIPNAADMSVERRIVNTELLQEKIIRNGEESITISDEGRRVIENAYSEKLGKENVITGCPAAVKAKIPGASHEDLVWAIINRIGSTINASIR